MPELLIITLNITIILIAYLLVYPKVAGSDGNKVASNDIIASCLSLLVAGSIFWNTGQVFNTILFDLNWFWFTIITYLILELPLMLWYYNKHNVWDSFHS